MTAFANHRGVQPLLWAMAGLALLELAVVHLFLALKWPRLAWPVSLVTLAGVVWLVRWIVSWKHCPHELDGAALRLRMGSLRTIVVPICAIASVEPVTAAATARAPGVRNLVPMALPNRLIRLHEPLPGKRRTTALAFRLDDPAAFDAALSGRLVSLGRTRS